MLAPASEVMPAVNAYIPQVIAQVIAWWWLLTVSACLFGDLFIEVLRAVVVALRVKSRGFYMRLALFFAFGLALGGVLTAAWGGVFS